MFEVVKIEFENGFVGLCPMPGKYSSFDEDFLQLVNAMPTVVVTCATKLHTLGIKWFQIAVDDFQIPDALREKEWNSMMPMLKRTVLSGGGVIFNCMGGCGRSGMFLLRLLLEMGWSSEVALERLREFRPCAIETEQQKFWAFK